MTHPSRGLGSSWAAVAPDLQGCQTKLDRAHKHLDELRREVNDTPFLTTMREELRSPVLEGSAWAVDLICTQVDTPPLRWSAIVGDIVQNLRAALDHLVCQLTIAGGGDCEHPKSQFAIACSRAVFDSQAKRLMSQIDERSRALFEALQPYHALDWLQRDGTMVYRHPLATLQRLSNHDKHRLPWLSMFGPGALSVEDVTLSNATYGGYSFPRRPYRVGETVCSVYFMPTGPAPVIEFDANLQPHVTLDDGSPLLDSLEGAACFVAGVLTEFGFEEQAQD